MTSLRRRPKALALIVIISIFVILYLNSNSRGSKSRDFYTSTVNALNAKEQSDTATRQKLLDIQRAAQAPIGAIPSLLTKKAPEEGSAETKSVAGRKKMKGGEKWDMATGKESAMADNLADGAKAKVVETEEEHEVEVELNSILKKGPIIIFSKSYCPHSQKAKLILLSKYTITPAPYVVELDQHPLGPRLQDALEKSTGRRTVPNVLINGKSIGGGDEVEALDVSGDLVAKVQSMGGKRIVEAKLAS